MAKKSEAKPTAKTPRRKEKPDCPQMTQNPADSEKKSVQSAKSAEASSLRVSVPLRLKASSLLDKRVVYCGDNLEQLAKLPDACVDLIYIDPPKPMQKEKCRMMKPARFPILHSSFRLLHLPHYHCDWHASHYVKVMLDQILGENNFSNAVCMV
jgi:hypothetical protein